MSSVGPELSVVLVTAPDMEVAETLGRALVEERLAACVNLVPSVTSLYRWEGRVQKSGEVLLLVKSTAEGYERLRDRILELHPYDTPEVLDLPVRRGDRRYLEWVVDSVENGS
jgi:periplasmic divalent cation tolerance protein